MVQLGSDLLVGLSFLGVGLLELFPAGEQALEAGGGDVLELSACVGSGGLQLVGGFLEGIIIVNILSAKRSKTKALQF